MFWQGESIIFWSVTSDIIFWTIDWLLQCIVFCSMHYRSIPTLVVIFVAVVVVVVVWKFLHLLQRAVLAQSGFGEVDPSILFVVVIGRLKQQISGHFLPDRALPEPERQRQSPQHQIELQQGAVNPQARRMPVEGGPNGQVVAAGVQLPIVVVVVTAAAAADSSFAPGSLRGCCCCCCCCSCYRKMEQRDGLRQKTINPKNNVGPESCRVLCERKLV
mmetsp:Transcript_86754/g.176601  ORF Transcript_86754/g.176601 Transcript_86754/m.176601 type:complete len:217 (-) Transcript_86754:48-698(-)